MSATLCAHLHCSLSLPQNSKNCVLMELILVVLTTRGRFQSEGLQRGRGKTAGYLQVVLALITRQSRARLRAVNTVDGTAIVTLLCQFRLDGTDGRHRIWIGGRIVSVIVLVVVRVIVVGVIVVRIQSEPEAVVKNKEPIVEEVGTVPVPAAVPICIVTFGDVTSAVESLATRQC